MNLRDTLQTLAPHDLVVPSRTVPYVYMTCVVTLTLAALIGFLGGYMMTDSRHAEERAGILHEYAELLRVKNDQIAVLQDQIIALQKVGAERDERMENAVNGMALVLEHLSKSIRRNRDNSRALEQAVEQMRGLSKPDAPPAPRPRPLIGPPPQTPVAPAKPSPHMGNLYKG